MLMPSSIESLRRRISHLQVVREESGAWTINGWATPKIMLGNKMLIDGKTLDECGYYILQMFLKMHVNAIVRDKAEF